MYGVYAPDAETLREVLDRPKRILGYPFCAYLVCLARSVDAEALTFLERFGAAVDHETGESLAFILLLDDATVLGTHDPDGYLQKRADASGHEYRGWPSPSEPFSRQDNSRDLPSLDFPETVDGRLRLADAVARRIKPDSIPSDAYYRGSPEWSLKFADHVGLSRSYLPCILAFDDPAASDDEDCVVVPLQDPEAAWESIVGAISTFVIQPDTQAFIRASERLRKAEREREIANRRLRLAEGELSQLQKALNECGVVPDKKGIHPDLVRARSIIGSLPPAPKGLLSWASSLSDEDRSFLLEAVRLAQGTGQDVTTLLAMLNSPNKTQVAREYFQTVRRLRKHWLQMSNTEDSPHIRSMLRAQLANALRWLGRPAEDLDHVLSVDAAHRQAFVEELEKRAPFQRSEVLSAWTVLTEAVRSQITRAVGGKRITQLQVKLAAAGQDASTASLRRDAAMAALCSTRMSPFLPHLAQSVQRVMPTHRTSGHIVSISRARIARGAAATAGGTGFLASIVQILQGIGVLK